MKPTEQKLITDMVKRSMPHEHNWKLIELVVKNTIKHMEARPWWKRLLKK